MSRSATVKAGPLVQTKYWRGGLDNLEAVKAFRISNEYA